MMPEEERWEVYCEAVVDIVNNEEMILEQFVEALRIFMRLGFHKDALECLRMLEKGFKTGERGKRRKLIRMNTWMSQV